MRAALFLFCLTICGCPKNVRSTVAPPVADGMMNCESSTVFTQDDLCQDVFTADGIACISCHGAGGCFQPVMGVYCAAGPPGCMGDPHCIKGPGAHHP